MGPDKKRKRSQEGPAAAEPSSAAAKTKRPKAAGTAESAPPKPAGPSTLRTVKDEESAFPRGGKMALTPLEFKEVDNEVKRDALFGEGGAGADGSEGKKAKRKPKKERAEKKEKKARKADDDAETGPKVEGLSYKRLVPGAMVLGCIRQVNKYDLALSLPDNLTGYVRLTGVSEKFTSKMEAIAQAEEDNDNDDDDDDDDEGGAEEDEERERLPKLSTMFRVGQYLRAYVLHTAEEKSTREKTAGTEKKKRIELSLYPSLVNEGLRKDELAVGYMVQASVASVEDHGLVMSLGLEGDVKGFLAAKDLGPEFSVATAQQGQVLLCAVTGTSSNGKIVKLSADLEQRPSKKGKLADGKSSRWLTEAATIDAFLPGTGVEVLITDVGNHGGIAGKIMGMLDAVIDYTHVAGWDKKDLSTRFTAGNKIKARVVSTFPNSDPKKVGLSILPHTLALTSMSETDALATLPISTILETTKIIAVEPNMGLFVDVGVPGKTGFVHISRISSETKIENLAQDEGAYKVGATPRARIVGFSAMDGLYLLSTEKRVLEQPFLRIEDIEVGAVVKGRISKVLESGKVLVEVADGISGMVDELHLSDVKLKHPEKKFREGLEVRARVLATSPRRRRLNLSLKKTLVNSDLPIIKSYEDVEPGMQSVGTLTGVMSNGAVVKFYSGVSAFLPVGEMSEAFIRDPREHFRVGQSVNIHVVSVDAEERKMRVSCKDPNAFGEDQKNALNSLKPGQVVSGVISEKNTEDVVVNLEGVGATGLKGTLVIGHLTDGSREKNMNKLKKLQAGTKLKQLVVLQAAKSNRMVRLSMKPSFIEAANAGTLITSFDKVKEGMEVKGSFKNSTDIGVFMAFADGITGLILRTHVPPEVQSLPNYGFFKDQTLTATVKEIDYAQKRFLLTMIPFVQKTEKAPRAEKTAVAAVNALDETAQTARDFFPGKITKAQITTVQQTQVNVRLADNIQGRIDVSQFFDSMDAIENKKHPLSKFKKGDVLDVKVIGIHDARTHVFLPITHKISNTKVPIFELTAKPSDIKKEGTEVLTLEKVQPGSTWLAFVNNITSDGAWVNISPNVRGRIKLLDLSDDVNQLKDHEHHFPIGCALKCRVTNVDVEHGKLDLSAKNAESQNLTFDGLSKSMVVPGRVTKIMDRLAIVQLSESVSGHIGLTDLADDYDTVKLSDLHKNDVIRVCVLDVDKSNKKVTLSSRPSRVLSSSLPVRDPEIQTVVNIKTGDVRRGFVKNVSDKGLFVHLGGNVTAWVKISDLADTYLKDWKSKFQVDQLVEGRIVAVDEPLKRVQMSLRESSVTGKPVKNQKALSDFEVGQIVTGKVRKVADYGVFIALDGSANVSGLCHKSEIADNKVEDISKLYSEGDPVKAKVISIDPEKRRINFGLKASYFKAPDGQEESEDEDSEEGSESEEEDEDESDGGVDLGDIKDLKEENDAESEAEDAGSDEEMTDAPAAAGDGLDAGGFDWTGANVFAKRGRDADSDSDSDTDAADRKASKRKRRKADEIKQDLTADLNSADPTSVSDYERMLLSAPNDSGLWIRYMAFQAQLSEIDKAREIARRALKTIDIREETEKLNVWTAMLNLENHYGNDESLEQVFTEACQYNDAQQVHEKLASIYVDSGKTSKAEELFKTTVKKFSQDIKIWLNAAEFFFTADDRAAARELLKRAMSALPDEQKPELVKRFAILEFKNGDPERGRTLFENLIETHSKRMDLWSVFLDMELKYGGGNNAEQVRDLFRRATKKEQCKPKQAQWLFKKWEAFEEKKGGEKKVNEVKERARKWVEERKKAAA